MPLPGNQTLCGRYLKTDDIESAQTAPLAPLILGVHGHYPFLGAGHGIDGDANC
jgi:hypothetical protein